MVTWAVLLLSSPQVWRVTGTCSSWWMAEIFWKSVRDHGKRHATTNSRRTARPCGMNPKRPWSPNRHVSPKKCAQGCVSQPFLCSCTRVLQWPILCFVCLYECWWMSLTEVTTALPSSNPFLRINGVKWMHKTKIKLHIICTGSITLMSVTVKWSCFI